MFKVLVVAYYFPPMGLNRVQRTLRFVKYMNQFNWEPTILTKDAVPYFAYDSDLLDELVGKNINIIRVGREVKYKLNTRFRNEEKKLPSEIIRKILNKLSKTFFIPDKKIFWAKKAFAKTEQLLKQNHFDAILVPGPPFSVMHIFSQLKKKHNIPLIIDYRDLWHMGYFSYYPTPIHRLLNKKMEYNVLRAADRIIVSNRKIKEKILNYFQFLTFNDVVIITNGYDDEEFRKAKIIPKHSKKMILTFSGIFMVYNTPKYFLKAFKEISIEYPDIAKNIELHFLGFLRKENQRLIRKLNLQEFVFDYGFVTHREAISKILSSDVLWMDINNKKNIDSVLPGKVYEYFATCKPIIGFVPDGTARSVLQEYPASYLCDPNDINEIKGTILRVYRHYKAGKFPKIDADFIYDFRSDYLTEKLTKEFQFLVKAEIH